jgi:hypothetical protein
MSIASVRTSPFKRHGNSRGGTGDRAQRYLVLDRGEEDPLSSFTHPSRPLHVTDDSFFDEGMGVLDTDKLQGSRHYRHPYFVFFVGSLPLRASRLSDKLLLYLVQSNDQTNLDVRNISMRCGFHFQNINPGTLPIYSFAHDCGRTLVRAECSYQKGSLNTNS